MDYTDKMLKEMQEVFAEGMKYNGTAENPNGTIYDKSNIEVGAAIENDSKE